MLGTRVVSHACWAAYLISLIGGFLVKATGQIEIAVYVKHSEEDIVVSLTPPPHFKCLRTNFKVVMTDIFCAIC